MSKIVSGYDKMRICRAIAEHPDVAQNPIRVVRAIIGSERASSRSQFTYLSPGSVRFDAIRNPIRIPKSAIATRDGAGWKIEIISDHTKLKQSKRGWPKGKPRKPQKDDETIGKATPIR